MTAHELTAAELAAGALELVTQGRRLVPLLPATKRPRFDGWQGDPLTTRDAVAGHWSQYPIDNIGVLGGRGLAILDVDVDSYGHLALRELEDRHGQLPETATVASGSGGRHYWFATDGNVPSWNPASGVEVRAKGRQTAAPPSVHPTGTIYRWLHRGALAPLPDWLRKPAGRPRKALDAQPLTDPILEIPPAVYVPALTGLEPDRHGKLSCPLHTDPDPSFHVYDTAERGWYCYGCQEGGTIVTLAARLAGIQGPVRGRDFLGILDYLRGRLG